MAPWLRTLVALTGDSSVPSTHTTVHTNYVTAFLSFRSHPHLLLGYLLIAGILQQQPHFLLILSSLQISLHIAVTLKETISASVFVNCLYDQHHRKTIWISSVATLLPIKGLHLVSFYSLGV